MTASTLDPLAWRERLQREIVLRPTAAQVPLGDAVGAVLAAQVTSPEEVPSAPVAAMDGFAVRRADLGIGTTVLPVTAELPARPGAVEPHRAGTAARIMTGAPVPLGADAVIEVEATDADPFGPAPEKVAVTLERIPALHRHLRLPGEEVARGEVLAEPEDRVGAGLVGLAATLGMATLPVLRPLDVAIVVTGDELTSGGTMAAGAVRESNGAMLAAALRADGTRARHHRSGDSPAQLRAALEAAADGADLVLTTGGIGHGAYDVVKLVLGERGTGSSEFVHLGLRPGGPQGAGTLPGGIPVVHLPGTPVGALVGYHLFVRPLLPGAAGELRRVRWEDPAGEGRSRGGGPRTVHALAARCSTDADGREVASPIPGRRLAPYGRAQAIALLGTARSGTASPAAASQVCGPNSSAEAAAEATALLIAL